MNLNKYDLPFHLRAGIKRLNYTLIKNKVETIEQLKKISIQTFLDLRCFGAKSFLELRKFLQNPDKYIKQPFYPVLYRRRYRN